MTTPLDGPEARTGAVRSADGTVIAFERVGDGPPLILVGGATQYRAIDPGTKDLARRLGERFTVLNYDRRGRGESGDTLPYAPEREFEDLAALVDAAGGEANVFGMSSGSILAVEAAARGVPISRLVIYEPPVLVDPNGPPPTERYLETLDGFTAAGRPGDAVAYFMEVVGMPEEAIEAFRREPIWPAFEAIGHTIAYDGRIMDPFSRATPIPPGRWDAARQPTLVVAGGDSPEWMRGAARAVADALPNAEVWTLPGQTHQYDPAVLAPVMIGFLTR